MLAGVSSKCHHIKIISEILVVIPCIVGVGSSSVADLMTADFLFRGIITAYIFCKKNFVVFEFAFSQIMKMFLLFVLPIMMNLNTGRITLLKR